MRNILRVESPECVLIAFVEIPVPTLTITDFIRLHTHTQSRRLAVVMNAECLHNDKAVNSYEICTTSLQNVYRCAFVWCLDFANSLLTIINGRIIIQLV